jgi:hypothetical protein
MLEGSRAHLDIVIRSLSYDRWIPYSLFAPED